MMRNKITPEMIRSLLDYDQNTGAFTWKAREPSIFSDKGSKTKEHSCNVWNVKYAGTIAGTVNAFGYLDISIFKVRFKAHRLAFLVVFDRWPENQIDHINMDRLDNRISNLREATNSQNNANRGKRVDNSSGIKGVYWDKNRMMWCAEIRTMRKKRTLGRFSTKEEAAIAYERAAIDSFGEFARTGE